MFIISCEKITDDHRGPVYTVRNLYPVGYTGVLCLPVIDEVTNI